MAENVDELIKSADEDLAESENIYCSNLSDLYIRRAIAKSLIAIAKILAGKDNDNA